MRAIGLESVRRVAAEPPRVRTCACAAMRTSAAETAGSSRRAPSVLAQCARSLAASGSVRSARTHTRGSRAWCPHLAGELVIAVYWMTDDMSCDRRTRAARFLELR